mgnify:FL=1|jgi:molecular chaperone IbpA|tara:strand:- start:129 stop:533 length:405 start_codon:yes stop_codon:yes gene_type:complete
MNELDILRNHFLGFHNDFFDSFKTVTTYPPYNIRQSKNDIGVIEFAVAGFTEEDLKVHVVENTLTVWGNKKDKGANSNDMSHKGISDRNFKKTFQLHKHVIVNGAQLKNGILSVAFHLDMPEAEKAHEIKIKKG